LKILENRNLASEVLFFEPKNLGFKTRFHHSTAVQNAYSNIPESGLCLQSHWC